MKNKKLLYSNPRDGNHCTYIPHMWPIVGGSNSSSLDDSERYSYVVTS